MSTDTLAEALAIQRAAAAEGFDWTEREALWAKLFEEIAELQADADQPARAAEELGDLLFMVVNIARHLGVEPGAALATANTKFQRRFARVMAGKTQYAPLGDPRRLMQMEAAWQDAKNEAER